MSAAGFTVAAAHVGMAGTALALTRLDVSGSGWHWSAAAAQIALANNDNFETQDKRALLPHTCCSMEPGIYLPVFGVRSEVDLLVLERDVEVTGVPIQQEIVALL